LSTRPSQSVPSYPNFSQVETTIGDPEARSVVGCPIATLCQASEAPTGGASGLPPLKLAEAGINSIPFVEDESAI